MQEDERPILLGERKISSIFHCLAFTTSQLEQKRKRSGCYLDGVKDLCWVRFLLLRRAGRSPSEEIVGCPRRQKSLMLLPLQGLTQQRKQPGGRDHTDLRRQSLGDVSSLLLLRAAVRVRLSNIKSNPRRGKWSIPSSISLPLHLQALIQDTCKRERRA